MGPSPLGQVRPDLLEAYVAKSGDPELDVPEWLRSGSPFGAINPIKVNSVFPATAKNDFSQAPAYEDTPAGWSNYKSVESAPDIAEQLLDTMVKKGWAKKCSSLKLMAEDLGIDERIPLNKLGLVSKVRSDGATKHRLVWDLRRSGVNQELHQGQCIVLPRFKDLVNDVLEVAQLNPSNSIQFTVVDFSDAFHLMPVHKDEIKYQTVVFNEEIYAFKVLVFGSAVAPTLWGRMAALLARSGQAIVPSQTTRIELYVDDPIIVAGGPLKS